MSNEFVIPLPFVDLKAQYATIRSEIDTAIQGVLDSTQFIQGPAVKEFETAFAAFCEAKYSIGVSSGTDALHLVLQACGVQEGDEVITSPLTFIATAEAISMCGAVPVFVDVDPQTYNIDPSKIAKCISNRTKIIMPVHLYGQPAEMDEIITIAQQNNLLVIEDSAQAHGARYRGKRTGNLGVAACYSFYPGKNLGCYGDGGHVVTNDEQIAHNVRLLRDHGRVEKYEHQVIGFGNRLDTIQAAILKTKLPYLDTWNEKRREVARLYIEQLAGLPVELPYVPDYIEPVWHIFAIQTKRRDELKDYLKKSGIGSGIHYPIPIHLQPAYQELGYKIGSFPCSEKISKEELSLPIYPEMSELDIKRVVKALKSFFN